MFEETIFPVHLVTCPVWCQPVMRAAGAVQGGENQEAVSLRRPVSRKVFHRGKGAGRPASSTSRGPVLTLKRCSRLAIIAITCHAKVKTLPWFSQDVTKVLQFYIVLREIGIFQLGDNFRIYLRAGENQPEISFIPNNGSGFQKWRRHNLEQNSSELRALLKNWNPDNVGHWCIKLLLFACTMKKKERGEKQEKKQSTRSKLAGLIDFFTLDQSVTNIFEYLNIFDPNIYSDIRSYQNFYPNIHSDIRSYQNFNTNIFGYLFVSKMFIRIYSDIRSYHFLDMNIFGYSFLSKSIRMSYSDLQALVEVVRVHDNKNC